MKKLDVITFGEAMAMFMAEEPGELHQVIHYTRELAGAETNFAIGMAKLGFQSGWISKVGEDAFGKFIKERLKQENVNIDHVLTTPEYPTGFQIKSKVFAGDPEVQYFRKGSAASQLSVEDADQEYVESAEHLHMTGIPLALASSTREFAMHVLNLMKSSGKSVSFDPNLRPSLWNSEEEMIRVTNEAAVQTDYVLPGMEEGEILTGHNTPEAIADFYLEQGVKGVVVKLGDEGAYFKTSLEEGYVNGLEVSQVVDTVGAGDGFAVGLVSGLLDGISLKDAVFRGNAIGALAVQSPGDNDGYPTREALETYIKPYLKGAK